jgi:serine/threonine-protein kinase
LIAAEETQPETTSEGRVEDPPSGRVRRTSAAPGDVVGDRYRIDGPIASGGHGTIHRAVHVELGVPVAIKVVHASQSGEPELIRRLAREARIAARVHHRNVLSVHDAGRLADGSPYLVMDLVDGEDLERRLGRGRLSIPAVVDLGRQLFSALTAIADAGVIHRDVKPANVMLHREADGAMLVKLLDFGIAHAEEETERVTQSGGVIGTPHYMSPEHLRGDELDARTDTYSAAAVLYEATTGHPPFDASATSIVVARILADTPEPIRTLRPDCPARLAHLIERAMSRGCEDRPAHPLELVAAFEELARAERLPTGAFAWLDETPPIELTRPRSRPEDRDDTLDGRIAGAIRLGWSRPVVAGLVLACAMALGAACMFAAAN